MTDETDEPDDRPYRCRYYSTLRIYGRISDMDEITRNLGLTPTSTHRRGDTGLVRKRPYEEDMWSYEAPVPGDRPLEVHLQTLWAHVRPHKDYLIGLKKTLTVDVFSGELSNGGAARFEVSSRALDMFRELEIPFGVSLIL